MISGQSRNCAIGCLINYGLILELGIYALQRLGAVISYLLLINQKKMSAFYILTRLS